ncbi:C2 domain-containing protein At1g53590-like [Triticum dicoccoides]|uniref:C2 domain-containing protein At1g53590-like n=1 Tax=Triticum dicoccoides TaxID=85692 RepID=UPI00188FEB4B|nr:C2 domain-containing protein At1g53590-like [Triticum dicoccoides]
MDAGDLSIVHHIGLVLLALWAAASFGFCHSVVFLIAFLYLYMVNARCAMRLRKRIQHAEMKSAYQQRLLSDGESVRWLNHAVKKMWPICMEKIVSQLLRPIIPWFLDKFKPWTVSKASVQELYMGRDSPIFTSTRVLPETSDDDHLVLELGMNFLSAEDMSVVLAMQLHKSVGLGMTANMHLTRMHVEGKVLLGVKFVRSWPFLGRLRLCFVEPPYFQMTVKPLVGHGLDVTEFPGISGWLDKLMDTAFGQTLVEPNMLVINMEKFSSTPSENNWFNIEERPPVAYVKLEILEGLDMKPADINGLSDPYVRGRIGPFKFQTQIQRKTLSPKWFEEFKIPITSWEASNELVMEVRDKDHMFDDSLGECTVDVNELRGGQRHDKWISLKNVKKGRIHLAITIEDVSEETEATTSLEESPAKTDVKLPLPTSADSKSDAAKLLEERKVIMDEVEHIDFDGQEQPGGVYVHRPGTGVPQTWESRKGRARNPDTEILQEVDISKEAPPAPTPKSGHGGMFNMGSFFRRNSKKSRDLDPIIPTSPGPQSAPELDPNLPRTPRQGSPDLDPRLPRTPRPNLKELGEKRTSIKIVVSDDASKGGDAGSLTEDMAKVVEKNAGEPGRSLTSTLSRKISMKRQDDKTSDVPGQADAYGREVVVNEGPVTIEGKPMDVHPATEDGNVQDVAVEAENTTRTS